MAARANARPAALLPEWNDRLRFAASWVTLRFGDPNAEPHAKGAGREEGTIYRAGCPRGHDRGCRCRARWRGTIARGGPEPPGVDSEAGEEAWARRVAAGLLRGRADRVCHLRAADGARGGL